MIKTIITPEHQDVSIHIPEDYVGKQLEILLYAVDELTQYSPAENRHSSFRGALRLTEIEHAELQQYVNNVRNEWNKVI